MAPVITLVGAPGSGKSTVGQLLADALGVGFIDTDEAVSIAAGMSVADIFFTMGEDGFRDLERLECLNALSGHDGVLALGGGAVASEDVRAALSGNAVVWLKVDANSAVSRVGLSGPRPVLLGTVRGRWAELLSIREPWYQSVSTSTVETTGRTPQQVAADVLHTVRPEGRDA